MPEFQLRFRVSPYRTDSGQPVQAKRAYLLCEFVRPAILCDAFLDTGAPFSVVPYSLGQRLPWQTLGHRLLPLPGSAPASLSWQGIPCDLGLSAVRCVDPATGTRSDPLQLLAKFPQQPGFASLEQTLILGVSLFDDNDVKVLIERVSGRLAGRLSVP
jgi:hypothetical protein